MSLLKFIYRLIVLPIQILVMGALLLMLVVCVQTERLDETAFKGVFERKLSKAFDRKVRIRGKIKANFAWPPRIVAERLEVANAQWGSKRPMLKVKRLVANLRTSRLIFGQAEIAELRLEGSEILIEQNAAGELNWTLKRDKAAGGLLKGPGPIVGAVLGAFGGTIVALAGSKLIIRRRGRKDQIIDLSGSDVEVKAQPAAVRSFRQQ